MPWTLYYNLQAPGEREALQIERHLLEECPDVDSIAVRRQGIPFGDTALDVFFVDELFRTNNEDLIRLALRRSSYPQVPPEVPRTVQQSIMDTYLRDPEARARFAERLIAPIRERRNYAALAQALMPIQQLPPGAMPIYDRDPGVTAMVQDFEAFHGSPALPSGVGASITQVEHHLAGGSASTRSTVRGLFGILATHEGHYLQLSGGFQPGNNGTWLITQVLDSSAVEIAGGHMVDVTGSILWRVEAPREDFGPTPHENQRPRGPIMPAWVANPAERGAVLRDIIAPEAFSLLDVRPVGVPVAPGGVAEAVEHVAGLFMGNDMRGDATVHSVLASYSRVEGYTPDEPGFFPLTRMPMVGFLPQESIKVSAQPETPRVTGWSVILDDDFLDDD